MSLASANRPPRAAERPRDLSRPLPASLSWSVLIVFVASFAVAFFVLGLPWWLPGLYVVLSLVALAVYGRDKRAARRGRPRVSEQSLLLLGALGGWPGSIVAQRVFRHKTRKRSFRRAFWTTVVLNVVTLAGFLTLAIVQGWTLELPALAGVLGLS
ncbi:DUF1294 domain-containing protein [Microbacterium insulae]|uniref:DUF1294 domain-containing protein n=1 Tax=Microbacterium insulae TaxID=483014 RepID=A0ABW3AJU9_9MICO